MISRRIVRHGQTHDRRAWLEFSGVSAPRRHQLRRRHRGLVASRMLRRAGIDDDGVWRSSRSVGSNGVNLTVLIGQHLRGAVGAAIALLGLPRFHSRSKRRSANFLSGSAARRGADYARRGGGNRDRSTATGPAAWRVVHQARPHTSLPQCCARRAALRSCRSFWGWRRSASALPPSRRR